MDNKKHQNEVIYVVLVFLSLNIELISLFSSVSFVDFEQLKVSLVAGEQQKILR